MDTFAFGVLNGQTQTAIYSYDFASNSFSRVFDRSMAMPGGIGAFDAISSVCSDGNRFAVAAAQLTGHSLEARGVLVPSTSACSPVASLAGWLARQI